MTVFFFGTSTSSKRKRKARCKEKLAGSTTQETARPLPQMKLLNAGNHKTIKGEAFGWKTYGLHLAPFNLSGKNVCSSATAGCSTACLNTAGRGIMHSVQAARIKKTRGFFEDRDGFLSQLYKEIQSSAKSATRKELNSCFPFESHKRYTVGESGCEILSKAPVLRLH
jgi:hypothetical protein